MAANKRAKSETDAKQQKPTDSRTAESKSVKKAQTPAKKTKVETGEFPEMDPEEKMMMQMLGFSGFTSTKGQHVEGNEGVGEADVKNKKQKRKYRQYLYVKGSYNIPLTQEDLKQKAESPMQE